MTDQALNRPCRRVAQRANSVAFNLLGHLEQGVDFRHIGIAFTQPFHHAPHPACAFAAGRALAAAFMLVEIRQASNRADDIGRFVHYDHGCRTKARAKLTQTVKIHRRVHDLRGRNQWNRRTAGDHS